jgi:hypothetical protein
MIWSEPHCLFAAGLPISGQYHQGPGQPEHFSTVSSANARMNLLLAIAIAILGAAAYAAVLQRRRGVRRVALAIVAVPILLAPLLVSDDDRLGRVLAAIFALFMLLKAWDAHVGANLGKRMEAPTYLRWLLNLCTLV